MFFKVLPLKNKTAEIIIPEALMNEKYENYSSVITVQAGLKSIIANMNFKSDLESDTIELSEDLLDFLSLPTDIKYQVILEENILKIGPVIGLLFTRRDSYLTEEALCECLSYTSYYEKFHGLLCLFSFNGIDFDNHMVEGYYYQPSTDDEAGCWKKGIFPFPGAIYRRLSLKKSELAKLKNLTNNNMFNSLYFNKWRFWQLISASENLKTYLPDTCWLTTFEDVKAMLEKHGKVYLKLVNGSLSIGLFEVTKDEKYYFRTTESQDPIIFDSDESASVFIKQLLLTRNYIVQQGITSLRLDDRIVDFRVVMQKDNTLDWKCNAVIGKVGIVNGICSCTEHRGGTMPFEGALERTCGLPKEKILLKLYELVIVCMTLCKELDTTGENYGDLAIDVALDNDMKIWILEVNKQQDFKILRPVWGGKHCTSVRSNVTKYAVGLTGFKVSE